VLKIDQATIDQMENAYPGIAEQIRQFNAAEFLACPHCASPDTASVQVGVIGRTINLCAATTKFHLRANGSPGDYISGTPAAGTQKFRRIGAEMDVTGTGFESRRPERFLATDLHR
jgi:hypothetical protein